MLFFNQLEQEIIKAELAGKSVIISMDANSKLRSMIIPGDPHMQSSNGLILEGIIERRGLLVCNAQIDRCDGVITRQRINSDGKEEKSVNSKFVLIQRFFYNIRKVLHCFLIPWF